MLLDTIASLFSKPHTELGTSDEAGKSIRERRSRSWGHQQSRFVLDDKFGYGTYRRRYDRESGTHRFEDGDRKTFVMRWQHEYIRCGQQTGDRRGIDPSRHLYAVSNPEYRRPFA